MAIDLAPAARIVALTVFFVIFVIWSRRLFTSVPGRMILRRIISLPTRPSALIREFKQEALTQQFIASRGMIRWTKHYLIYFGAIGLLVFHGLPRIIFAMTEEQLFPWATPELRIVAHYVFAFPLVIGAILSVLRHIQLGDFKGVKRFYHAIPIAVIFSIAATGVLVFQLEYIPYLFGLLDETGRRGPLFIIHTLTVYGIIIVLPFTKYRHIPLRLLAMLVGSKRGGILQCSKCGRTVPLTYSSYPKGGIAKNQDSAEVICSACRRRYWIRWSST